MSTTTETHLKPLPKLGGAEPKLAPLPVPVPPAPAPQLHPLPRAAAPEPAAAPAEAADSVDELASRIASLAPLPVPAGAADTPRAESSAPAGSPTPLAPLPAMQVEAAADPAPVELEHEDDVPEVLAPAPLPSPTRADAERVEQEPVVEQVEAPTAESQAPLAPLPTVQVAADPAPVELEHEDDVPVVPAPALLQSPARAEVEPAEPEVEQVKAPPAPAPVAEAPAAPVDPEPVEEPAAEVTASSASSQPVRLSRRAMREAREAAAAARAGQLHPSEHSWLDVAAHRTMLVGLTFKHLWLSGLTDLELPADLRDELESLRDAAWCLELEIERLTLAHDGRATAPAGHITSDGDPIDHPLHYNSDPSGIECIEVVQWHNFAIGNALKYLWRAGLKVDAHGDAVAKEVEDLGKAAWYVRQEITRKELIQARRAAV